ncbi:hypothetical protein PIB30_077232 [Stylosanthes scabra]|uniref:Uncharacterized protein n=1 Tax=Stylosanthes scabra TaxID=79078 RepID=A0ABU6XSL9_9FABA|nr:hypothetical protein [Stylosanthes scabra]
MGLRNSHTWASRIISACSTLYVDFSTYNVESLSNSSLNPKFSRMTYKLTYNVKSINLCGNNNLLTFYYLIRSGAHTGGSPEFRKDFGHQGNKDKHILEFDPEIEQTLHKLRKQAKLQKQPHEISSEEAFEEVSVNMAEEGDQQKTLGEFTVPTTASCGSSIVRPIVEAGLIHLIQQD